MSEILRTNGRIEDLRTHQELGQLIPEWIQTDREAIYYFLLKAIALDDRASLGGRVLLADEVGGNDCDLAQALVRLQIETAGRTNEELERVADTMRANSCQRTTPSPRARPR